MGIQVGSNLDGSNHLITMKPEPIITLCADHELTKTRQRYPPFETLNFDADSYKANEPSSERSQNL
jgi:hypothetical protein